MGNGAAPVGVGDLRFGTAGKASFNVVRSEGNGVDMRDAGCRSRRSGSAVRTPSREPTADTGIETGEAWLRKYMEPSRQPQPRRVENRRSEASTSLGSSAACIDRCPPLRRLRRAAMTADGVRMALDAWSARRWGRWRRSRCLGLEFDGRGWTWRRELVCHRGRQDTFRGVWSLFTAISKHVSLVPCSIPQSRHQKMQRPAPQQVVAEQATSGRLRSRKQILPCIYAWKAHHIEQVPHQTGTPCTSRMVIAILLYSLHGGTCFCRRRSVLTGLFPPSLHPTLPSIRPSRSAAEFSSSPLSSLSRSQNFSRKIQTRARRICLAKVDMWFAWLSRASRHGCRDVVHPRFSVYKCLKKMK